VGWLNAQVDCAVFLFGKDCDWTFILGHAGVVCAAPITTSSYPPMRWSFNMLQAMWNEGEYHLDICCATKGAHIEI
jgi:hypothetical protein